MVRADNKAVVTSTMARVDSKDVVTSTMARALKGEGSQLKDLQGNGTLQRSQLQCATRRRIRTRTDLHNCRHTFVVMVLVHRRLEGASHQRHVKGHLGVYKIRMRMRRKGSEGMSGMMSTLRLQ